MIDRCSRRTNPAFRNYGGRGIQVCPAWLVFEQFYADMGDPPPGTSIDRVNNDGNYEPGNCRWATRKTQGRNRRGLLAIDGDRCLAEVVEGGPIKYGTAHSRIAKHGWSAADALSVPAIVGQKFQRKVKSK